MVSTREFKLLQEERDALRARIAELEALLEPPKPCEDTEPSEDLPE